MSRSYKKPYYTDKAHWKKKLASRAYRRVCKTITNQFVIHWDDYMIDYNDDWWNDWKWDEKREIEYLPHPLKDKFPEPIYPHRYSITNPYDICDWVFIQEDKEIVFSETFACSKIITLDSVTAYKKACRK